MNKFKKKIAILGATGHIAKGLIYHFSKSELYELTLFARSLDRVKEFLHNIQFNKEIFIKKFDELNDQSYDVVINCVGIGEPGKLQLNSSSIFNLTETFDNLLLNYLEKLPDTLYINISSGAVYGTDFTSSVEETSPSRFDINSLNSNHYYGIAKMNSEAKHRALDRYHIIDIRVFGYFSRFINLNGKYLITEIISSVMNQKQIITGSANITRDYAHPQDLVSLIERCIDRVKINNVFDLYSLKPVTKFEILDYFSLNYGLKYIIDDSHSTVTATGSKNNYYSVNKRAQTIGYFPKYSSLDSIISGTKEILNK